MSREDLKRVMEQEKLSGRAAADVLNVSAATFCRILSGHRAITEESLAAAITYLQNRDGPPPVLEAVGVRPKRADYRLTLDDAQRARLEKLARDLDQEPAEMLQSLVTVLLWPAPPSSVKSRWFRMMSGWGKH